MKTFCAYWNIAPLSNYANSNIEFVLLFEKKIYN